MKRFLLWSFDRGSFQYDVICGLILVFIFLIPGHRFNDRPAYMRVSAADPVVKKTAENGIEVFTVKLDRAVFWDNSVHQAEAVESLQKFVKVPIKTIDLKPIYTTTGMTIAYAIWIEPLEGK